MNILTDIFRQNTVNFSYSSTVLGHKIGVTLPFTPYEIPERRMMANRL